MSVWKFIFEETEGWPTLFFFNESGEHPAWPILAGQHSMNSGHLTESYVSSKELQDGAG